MPIDYVNLSKTQPATNRRPWLTGGAKYTLVVTQAKETSQTKPKVKHGLVFEMRVIESTPNGKGTRPLSTGDETALYFDLMSEIGTKNLMAFVNAVAGRDLVQNPSDTPETSALKVKVLQAFINGECEGRVVSCYATDGKENPKEPGTFFANFSWSPMKNTDESVAKNRAEYIVGEDEF